MDKGNKDGPNGRPHENRELFVVELDDRLEFGAAVIDSDLQADDNTGCINQSDCTRTNNTACQNDRGC